MLFPKEKLQSIIYNEEEGFTIIEDKVVDTSRWSIIHEVIFKDASTEKFYETGYSVGATEMQDERPFQYDDDEIECSEVKPVEKVIIVYEKV